MIFDAHAYMGYQPVFQEQGLPALLTPKDMVGLLDRAGVDAAFVAPPGERNSDYAEGNARIAAGIKEFPKRLYGFARINANKGPKAVDDVNRWVKDQGIHGIKLNGFSEHYYVNDRQLVGPILETAQALDIPILIHTGGHERCTPALVWDIALDFPRAKIIVGHLGEPGYLMDAIAVLKRLPNLYTETAGVMPPSIRRMVREIGAERVMYGSNGPYQRMEMVVEFIRKYSNLSEEEARLVLGDNLARVMNLTV